MLSTVKLSSFNESFLLNYSQHSVPAISLEAKSSGGFVLHFLYSLLSMFSAGVWAFPITNSTTNPSQHFSRPEPKSSVVSPNSKQTKQNKTKIKEFELFLSRNSVGKKKGLGVRGNFK